MNWILLTTPEQVSEIKVKSATSFQVIFKHSTRCSISSMVLNRLERSDAPADIDFYFLDLIAHRSISNLVAETFQIHHESPQLLLIRNGECIYEESHMGIDMDELTAQLLPA
ncbi:MAG: bacillithiol system redox-active protein YtxJ [Bacteroidota bacterium]|nr:bacillithiol system redox-active protein YtxJ [Bacteroidota bacterium]